MRKILLFISLMCVTSVYSQSEVTRSTMFSIGSTNRLDTYLTPLEYKGGDVRFISDVMRKRKSGWDTKLTHDAGFDLSKNRADNAKTLAGHYDFTFSMMHRWTSANNKFSFHLGVMSEAYLGFAYNMRNAANNPAQGYASLHLGGATMMTYTTPLKLKKHPVAIGYEARLPLVGMMFSPNYGQSYYEIFSRGDYDNNIVCNTVATPSFRQMLTIDMPVSNSTSIRLGYLNDIRQATPNNLKQHTYTHAAVIGVTKKL